VPRADALVAEDAPEFVHAVEPSDHQTLGGEREVWFGSNLILLFGIDADAKGQGKRARRRVGEIRNMARMRRAENRGEVAFTRTK